MEKYFFIKTFLFIIIVINTEDTWGIKLVRNRTKLISTKTQNGEEITNYNYIKFNHFHRVIVSEKLLNDYNICEGECVAIALTHYNYEREIIADNERCHGNFTSCVIENRGLPVNDDVNMSCDECLCICERETATLMETTPVIDSICLDPVSANVKSNYVITGVRFHVHYNTIILQTLQSKLLPNSVLKTNSSFWNEPPKKCKKIAKIKYGESFFALDDIILDDGYLVTDVAIRKCDETWNYQGVKLQTIRNCVGNLNYFHLVVYGAPRSNIENGIVRGFIEKSPSWTKNRTDLTNSNMRPSDIVLPLLKNLSVSGEHYVQFRPSSWAESRGKDIIPYIDTREIKYRPYKPIIGIGVYYYGTNDYGGYLSPEVFIAER